MWLNGRLVPDHKTIADFRRHNGAAIRKTCAQFFQLCRRIGVLKGTWSRSMAANSRRSITVIVTSAKGRLPAAWRIWKPRSLAISRKLNGLTVRKQARLGQNVQPI